MTSKAERKRHKRAARQMGGRAAPASVSRHADVAVRSPSIATDKEREPVPSAYRGPTELQEAAWRWFRELRLAADAGRPNGAAAAAELKLIRTHLTDDEYAVMCEAARGHMYTAHRVGRSRQSAYAMELSGIRKLVVYRGMGSA